MSAAKKRSTRPIYLTPQRLVNPETGEVVKALVPCSAIDRRLLNEKRLRVGDEVRADLKNRRNVKFHRLVHALGIMLVEHIEAFHGLNCHDAIKRVQRESGICCEQQDIDVPGVGKLVVNVAQSIAFDCMDEGEFQYLWEGICRHVAEKYWPDLTEEQIADQAGLMPDRQVAA